MCVLEPIVKNCSNYCLKFGGSEHRPSHSDLHAHPDLHLHQHQDEHRDDPYKKMTNDRSRADGNVTNNGSINEIYRSNSASGSRFSTKDSVQLAIGERTPLVRCNSLCSEANIDGHEIKRLVGDVRSPDGFDPESSLIAMNFPPGSTELDAASFFSWFVPVVRVDKLCSSTAAGEQNFSIVRFLKFPSKFRNEKLNLICQKKRKAHPEVVVCVEIICVCKLCLCLSDISKWAAKVRLQYVRDRISKL